jgi:alpha 1,3-glucosidase
MEHFRPKPIKSEENEEDKDKAASDEQPALVFQKRGASASQAKAWAGFEEHDSGEWEEKWDKKPDSKPKGPEALSLDMFFPGKQFLFGIPEHASPLNLRSTKGEKEGDFTDPYRLMNTDVFEYDADSPMSLYGSVPIIHAQSATGSVSAFFLSAAETWIDIDRTKTGSHTHWIAESGILDLLIMLEDTPAKNIQKFTELVGRSTAPQTFALGYHQCRWNYMSDSDVLNVQSRFDEEDIPMDVMWLDIEYSKDHMYGVWEELNFANPEKMVEGLDDRGRKLVIIMDPHLKRTDSYWLYSEAQSNELLVKSPSGTGEYEGWCWSGSASWLDMFNPLATTWWKKQYTLDSKGKGPIKANARNVHIWNDMNEPAIFNGPEITSPKDVKHHGGWEHRDIHNINGVLFHAATHEALRAREGSGLKLERRPFVLSRAWWVGTQRFGAIWTGDNLGTWEHLAVSVPMILANNIAGMSFCGADIGGFFGDPSPEMLTRWYQAGIFEPFFRAHAHIDTKRREPFLLEEPYKSWVRELIRWRYKMLPIWTTAFREASDEGSGLPVLRPQFLMFPNDQAGFEIDDQYYIGDSGLLVKPAVKEGADHVNIYLSDANRPYYNFFTGEVHRGSQSASKDNKVRVEAPLGGQAPVLQRGGSIVPLRERVRRAAELGWRDPVTLIIALDDEADSPEGIRASGTLYLDDGQTYHYKEGAFIWRRFTFETKRGGKRHVIKSRDETRLRVSEGTASSSSSSLSSTAVGFSPAYDPSNEFAEAIRDVRVEKIIVLGLEERKAGYEVRVKGDVLLSSSTSESVSSASSSGEDVLATTWTAGEAAGTATGAGVGRKKLKAGATPLKASRLVIKDPRALVRGDWEVEIIGKDE